MYPDFIIVCDDIEKQESKFDTLTNPSVIIEIMGESTKEKDLGIKFWRYLQIPSLKEYILIDSIKFGIKVIKIQQDNSLKHYDTENINDSLFINTINMQIPLKDIYKNVSFFDGQTFSQNVPL